MGSPGRRARVRAVLSQALPYIDSPCFAGGGDGYLDDMPRRDEYDRKAAAARPPPGTSPELAGCYSYPLLSAEQEHHLFRKMNYLKHLYAACQARMCHGDARPLDSAVSYRELALEVQCLLVCSNMRLVVSVAKGFSRFRPLWEVAADGYPVLIKAVTKFDFGRGFKFSTYASWALKKHYWRAGQEEAGARGELVGCPGHVFDEEPSGEDSSVDDADSAAGAATSLRAVLSYLEPRERAVLRLRYPGGGEPNLTLDQVGRRIGVTKERARQIELCGLARAGIIARNVGLRN